MISFAKEIDSRRPENERAWKDDEMPSAMWYHRFKERYNLSLRCPRNESVARSEMSTPEVRDEMFKRYNELLAKFKFTADVIFNMDETGMQIVTKTPKVVARKGDKTVVSRKPGERSETISVACCANAAGTVILPPFVIFKGGSLTTNTKISNYPPDTTFACSDSGYMVSELFRHWLDLFVKKIPPARPVLLILDGHGSHVQYDVLKFCRENLIELFCLPPHTTHLYQPLDIAVFKPLKENFKHQATKYIRKHKSKVNKQNFGQIFTPSYLRSVTPMNIVNGFKESGFWNPNDKNESNLSGTPSPSGMNGSVSSISSGDSASASHHTSSSVDSARDSSSPTSSTISTSTPNASNPAQNGSIVVEVIKELLQCTPPEKKKPSKRITTSRVLTSKEYMEQVESLTRRRLSFKRSANDEGKQMRIQI